MEKSIEHLRQPLYQLKEEIKVHFLQNIIFSDVFNQPLVPLSFKSWTIILVSNSLFSCYDAFQ